MKKPDLKTISVDQLVVHFAQLAIQQDKALLEEDIDQVNRLYDRLKDVEHELRAREGDQRHALISLYEHPNMQVRVKAAKATLAVMPSAARDVLESVRASKWQPQAGEAGMSLRNLDLGVYKPT